MHLEEGRVWQTYDMLDRPHQLPQTVTSPVLGESHGSVFPKQLRKLKSWTSSSGDVSSGDVSSNPSPDNGEGGGLNSGWHCNKQGCNVGRHSKRRYLAPISKMNLVDLSRIDPRGKKMCMQTKLADLGGGLSGNGSDDYTPLLITSTEDLVLPISAAAAGEDGRANQQARWRRSREAVTKFLDTLTRTFCLPLLG